MLVEVPIRPAAPLIHVDESLHADTGIANRTTAWIAIAGPAVIAVAMLFDRPVSNWVHDSRFPDALKTVLMVIRQPGNYLFTAVLAGLLLWRRRFDTRTFVAFLLTTGAASLLASTLKWCFGRIRPFKGAPPFEWHPFPLLYKDWGVGAILSFPSGDSSLAFATATLVAHLFPRYALVGYAWALIVAVTRVLQGAHYPSDVAAGSLLGVLAARLLFDAFSRRLQPSALAERPAGL